MHLERIFQNKEEVYQLCICIPEINNTENFEGHPHYKNVLQLKSMNLSDILSDELPLPKRRKPPS